MKKCISWSEIFLSFSFVCYLGAMEDMSVKAEEHKRVQTQEYLQLFEPIHPLQSRKTLGQIYAVDGIYNDETSLQEINQRGKRCLDFLIQRGFDVNGILKDEEVAAVPVLEKQSTPLLWLALCAEVARLTHIFLTGKEPSAAWVQRYTDHTKFLMQALRDAGACDAENKQIKQ